MPKKIFIGSLSFQTSSEDLQQLFAGLGRPVSIRLADADDGKSRVAHIEMASDDDAAAAVQRLNGRDINGRNIVVREG